ncbi:autophagy-related protein 16-1 isoform X1 [Bombus vosnesenskii]|uniref:Autophagy-related protein 16-1 isoform X1 n=5 Tax=Apinae TaxID=70987 RepID=A0A6J3KK97_9HYME|nr:autophagy-related protein 16-1 isoform X1 [Bombus vancouverensis nearcticus]XP_033298801.1 autophagy-related protein 16-1 isoform X1 [Bombus bifarius]XP_033352314.1 autophagy-related protein 16-1 isoform X1 [Bombus vosnesenskii]
MAASESGVSSHSREDSNWRKDLILQLQERNKKQTYCFLDLISLHNRLFESANTLRGENIQLTVANETLRREAASGTPGLSVNADLEARLLKQAEELATLHKRKGEHTQQIVDLNNKLQEMLKELQIKEASVVESMELNANLRLEVSKSLSRERELESINQMLKDEHQALQLAFASLEEKLRKTQEENRQLIERLIKYKTRDAEKVNEENDNFLNESFSSPTAFLMQTISKFGKRQAKVQKELEDAARDTRPVSPDRSSLKEGISGLPTAVPTKVSVTFTAHDGEVYAVKWSPAERMLATGGADRKVKLWNISKGMSESKGVLIGSNAGVMCVDFDSTGTLMLAASNDYASRVWTVNDFRLKHTLTGHCGKVMAAKFLGEPSKVVTGSYDRTLKIWDLRSKACIETKFAGSSCNDLVTSDGAGSTIISGHFDQRIRFWDTRAESSSNDILLEGKVTSLDLSRDANYLLSCVRDDTLKLIDLRMKKIIGSFSADGFKVGFDWTRATFSPDGQYIAVGSSDGSVFIWSVTTNMIETVLKNHSTVVTAVSWHPHGAYLASVDKAKTVTVWGDHV